MKHLCYGSVFLLGLFAACTSRFTWPKDSQSVSRDSVSVYLLWPQQDSNQSVKQFKTEVVVYGKEIEGILLLKKQAKETYRATFLAKGAMKLFDMELSPDTFIVYEKAPQLSNPAALRTLAHDMQLLTIPLHQTFFPKEVKKAGASTWWGLQFQNQYLYLEQEHNQWLQLIETDQNRKKNVAIHFDAYKNQRPTQIRLQHLRFRMKIELTLLE